MPQTPNILTLDVLVTGPEFRSDENRLAFVRIAEAVEQFSAHSREAIMLIRQPTQLDRDHFAILWSHGLAIVAFYNQTGVIYGGLTGPWRMEPVNGLFSNPYEELQPYAAQIAGSATTGQSLPCSVVAIFTGPVRELDVDTSNSEVPFEAMTLDFAVARSIVHMPNLLRVVDRKAVTIPILTIEKLASSLDHSEHRPVVEYIGQTNTDTLSYSPAKGEGSRAKLWIIPAIILAVAFIVYMMLASRQPSKIALPDTDRSSSASPARGRGTGRIVIELPKDVQLFVSPELYSSRLALDQALAHAQGKRFLPATEHVIVYDSLTLAKGVYGYFKVDNAWRKGKLLQTFQPTDTIHIDNFLGPLP